MNNNRIIRTLIVDDEPPARTKIKRFLQNEPDIQIIGECKDGIEAVEAINNQQPDLVFLDIEMPGIKGIDVLKYIDTVDLPLIVFVTAYDQYAIRAFEIHALDYLLKPFDRIRFQTTMARVRETKIQQEQNGATNSIMGLIEELKKKEGYQTRIMVKQKDKMIMLETDKIKWLESQKNYIDLHTATETYTIRETMSNLETKLNPNKFIRVNRSTIINIDHVAELQPFSKKEYVIIFKTKERFTLNKTYYQNFEALFN